MTTPETPSVFFGRELTITVAGIRIPMRAVEFYQPKTQMQSLRCIFEVEKTSESTPNKSTLSVYNLNQAHRSAIVEKFPLIIEAGYAGVAQKLFYGTIKTADSRREEVDWVTTVTAEDDGLASAYSTRRLALTLGPGTTINALLGVVTTALGVGLGNSAAAFTAPMRGLAMFKKGVTVEGTAAEILDKYVPAIGKRWSIQDNMLQVLGPQEPFMVQAAVLSPGSGLIGVPERGEGGSIKARSLLNPILTPGGFFIVKCQSVVGNYKVDKVRHFGDTFGQDWYSDVEGKPLA